LSVLPLIAGWHFSGRSTTERHPQSL
jgi:hypothetical protein